MDLPKLTRKNINKNGGDYLNGKPLDLERRKDIIERYKNGEKVTSIATTLKVTHGVVSKIIKHFNKTGSFLPKQRSNPTKKKQAKQKAIKFSVDKILDGTSKAEPKRPRNLFAPEQIQILEKYFTVNPYLDAASKKEMAEKTKLSDKEITTWFTNKRSRLRKHLLDTSDSSLSAASETSISSSGSNLSANNFPSSTSSSSSFSSNQNFFIAPECPTIPVIDTRPISNIPNATYLPPSPLPPQPLLFSNFQPMQHFQLLSNIIQHASFLNFMQQTFQNPNIS